MWRKSGESGGKKTPWQPATSQWTRWLCLCSQLLLVWLLERSAFSRLFHLLSLSHLRPPIAEITPLFFLVLRFAFHRSCLNQTINHWAKKAAQNSPFFPSIWRSFLVRLWRIFWFVFSRRSRAVHAEKERKVSMLSWWKMQHNVIKKSSSMRFWSLNIYLHFHLNFIQLFSTRKFHILIRFCCLPSSCSPPYVPIMFFLIAARTHSALPDVDAWEIYLYMKKASLVFTSLFSFSFFLFLSFYSTFHSPQRCWLDINKFMLNLF